MKEKFVVNKYVFVSYVNMFVIILLKFVILFYLLLRMYDLWVFGN